MSSITYVSPPRPIEVKKLIANRVLRGLSRGIRPSKAVDRKLQREGSGYVVYMVTHNILRVLEALVKFQQSHILSQLLKQDLYKDTTAAAAHESHTNT